MKPSKNCSLKSQKTEPEKILARIGVPPRDGYAVLGACVEINRYAGEHGR
jgi:hypothetical protein